MFYFINVLILTATIGLANAEFCDVLNSIPIEGEHYTMPDSSLLYKGVTYTKNQWTNSSIKLVNGTKVIAEKHLRGCLCDITECIRLCCPVGHVFVDKNCIKYNGSFELNMDVYQDNGQYKKVDLAADSSYKQRLVAGKPCSQMYNLDPMEFSDDSYHFMMNGNINLTLDDGKLLNHQLYCLSAELSQNKTKEIEIFVSRCFEKEPIAESVLYPIGMLCSVPFLIATFLVYALIPELNRTNHGKSLMFYVFALGVGYTSLSVGQLHTGLSIAMPVCRILGYVTYFSLLLSFFWSNVMCIDIWLKFRNTMMNNHTKFLCYICYACGSPFLLLLCVISIDQHLFNVPEEWRPDVGVKTCFIKKNRHVELVYLYVPMACLLASNLVLFIITALKIRTVRQATSAIRKGDSQRHSRLNDDTDRFILYVRLFIVMGITWTLEVVSWAIESNKQNWKWVFTFSDICNCIQGIIIFFLFVWKPKIKELIANRLSIIIEVLTSSPENTRLNY